MPRPPALDLTGETYGGWTALRSLGRVKGNTQWECRCTCGNVYPVFLANLRSGASTRCRPCFVKNRRRVRYE